MTVTLPPRHISPSTAWRTSGGSAQPTQPAPVSFGGTLGALAVAVGFGVLVAHMLDLHGHTCDQCGRRWRHFGAFNLGDEKSHTCSCCGQVQWWKCGAPHVLRGSQFAQAPTVPSTLVPQPTLAVPAFAVPDAAGIPAAFPAVFSTPPAVPAVPNAFPSPAAQPPFAIQTRRRIW